MKIYRGFNVHMGKKAQLKMLLAILEKVGNVDNRADTIIHFTDEEVDFADKLSQNIDDAVDFDDEAVDTDLASTDD